MVFVDVAWGCIQTVFLPRLSPCDGRSQINFGSVGLEGKKFDRRSMSDVDVSGRGLDRFSEGENVSFSLGESGVVDFMLVFPVNPFVEGVEYESTLCCRRRERGQ